MICNKWRTFLKLLFLDQTVLYILSSRLFNSIAGVVSIFFILRYLPTETQAYYYTFVSVIAFSSFFEFGMSTLTIQYVSHFMADIKWKRGVLYGKFERKRNVLSFIKRALILNALFAILMVISLIIIGYFIFSIDIFLFETNVFFAWIFLVIFTGVSTLLNGMLNVLEGAGKVKEVSKIRLLVSVFSIPVLWLSIIFGGSVYALSLQIFTMIVVSFACLYSKYRFVFLSAIRVNDKVTNFNFIKSIFPLQWRLTVSFFGNYLSSQIYVPLLFSLGFVELAGKFGMTLQIVNAINGFAITWINSKFATFSTLIAKYNHKEMRSEFKSTFLNSCIILALLVFLFLLFYSYMSISAYPFSERVVSVRYLILLCFCIASNHIYGAINIYLLSYKQDLLFQLTFYRVLFFFMSIALYSLFNMPINFIVVYAINSIVIAMLGSIIIFIRHDNSIRCIN